MKAKSIFLLVYLLSVLLCNAQPPCAAVRTELGWRTDTVYLESPYYAGRTYTWVSTSGDVVIPNGNQVTVIRGSLTGGSLELTVSEPGCIDTYDAPLSDNTFSDVPLAGPLSVCGSDPVMYECTWTQGQGAPAIYFHSVYVTGGTIVAQHSTQVPGNNAWNEKTWVRWGSGPTGKIISTHGMSSTFIYGISNNWVRDVTIDCGLQGTDHPCLGTPATFTKNCSNGSGYQWSTTNGTILSGQGTGTVSIVWNSLGSDTIVTIFNSAACGGLDTNYFPVTITSYPTNTVFGDTFSCPFALDTFSTSVIPSLQWPSVQKNWTATGPSLNQSGPFRNVFTYTHGPGPLETVVLTTDDHGCVTRDTMTVTILPAPPINLGANPTICTGDSIQLNAGLGFGSYAWSTGNTTNAIWASQSIPYSITVTDPLNGCAAADTVIPIIEPDCVWPGDANHDLVVDANDFLDIGVAFGDVGPIRPGATTNWQGQPSVNWVNSFLSGQNHKHADSDGNGVVDFPDTLPVSLFQGLTHLRIGERDGGIPVRLRPSQVIFAGQDSIDLILSIGDPGFPADSVYGIVFTLNYSPSDVLPGVFGKAIPSFLGIPGTQLIHMSQEAPGGGAVTLALVRTDHANAFGHGDVARIRLRAQSSLWANQGHVQLPLAIGHVRLIDHSGSDLLASSTADTVWLYDLGFVATPEGNGTQRLSLSPNPAHEELQISLPLLSSGRVLVRLVDANGKVVLSEEMMGIMSNRHTILTVDVRQLPNGIYAIQAQDNRETYLGRVVVTH